MYIQKFFTDYELDSYRIVNDDTVTDMVARAFHISLYQSDAKVDIRVDSSSIPHTTADVTINKIEITFEYPDKPMEVIEFCKADHITIGNIIRTLGDSKYDGD